MHTNRTADQLLKVGSGDTVLRRAAPIRPPSTLQRFDVDSTSPPSTRDSSPGWVIATDAMVTGPGSTLSTLNPSRGATTSPPTHREWSPAQQRRRHPDPLCDPTTRTTAGLEEATGTTALSHFDLMIKRDRLSSLRARLRMGLHRHERPTNAARQASQSSCPLQSNVGTQSPRLSVVSK